MWWATCGGLLMWLSSFAHMWWAAILGAAALYLGLQRGNRLAVSAIYSLALFAPLVWWVSVLGIEAWALLVMMCIVPMLALALVKLPSGRTGPVVFAGLYPLVEQLHASAPWGGFPWGLIAYSQLDGPLLWLSRIGGQALLASAVCFLGACLAHIRIHPRAAVAGMIVCVTATGGASVFRSHNAGTLTVAAVQGGVPRPELPGMEQVLAVLNNHIQQTMRTDVSHVNLVVWPESASMADPLHDPATTAQINALVATIKVPLVVGGVVLDPGAAGPSNSALLWLPGTGVVARYDKRHLVPFGEYIPNRQAVGRVVAPFTNVTTDYVPGKSVGLFSALGQRLGAVICFEVAYDNQVAEAIHAGATGILALSNNSTYLGTNQPWQQFAITRFRAFEHSRPIVVATTSGVSGVIGPDGGVVASAGEVGSASVVGSMRMQTGLMPIDQFGPWPLWVCAGVLVLHGTRRRALQFQRAA